MRMQRWAAWPTHRRALHLPVFPLGFVDVTVGASSNFAALVLKQVLHSLPLRRQLHLEIIVHFREVCRSLFRWWAVLSGRLKGVAGCHSRGYHKGLSVLEGGRGLLVVVGLVKPPLSSLHRRRPLLFSPARGDAGPTLQYHVRRCRQPSPHDARSPSRARSRPSPGRRALSGTRAPFLTESSVQTQRVADYCRLTTHVSRNKELQIAGLHTKTTQGAGITNSGSDSIYKTADAG